MAKSRKEKRLARKQKAEEQVRQNLRTSEEARFDKVYRAWSSRSLIKNGLTVRLVTTSGKKRRGRVSLYNVQEGV